MKFRIAEIFGPTIQGEGRNVGMPCHFVRFGGCDFRCEWCDTPHAVLPELVAQLPKMDEWEIFHKVNHLGNDNDFIRWVVLTGGNPALFSLENLIDIFHHAHFQVMLETQGSVFREWFGKIDDLCFSPKPPSAGNTTNLTTLRHIIDRTALVWEDRGQLFRRPYLKVPVFTTEDYEYAIEVRRSFSEFQLYISVGNSDPSLPTVGNPNPEPRPGQGVLETRHLLMKSFEITLARIFTSYPELQDCQIFPQQHVLLWGNQRGH